MQKEDLRIKSITLKNFKKFKNLKIIFEDKAGKAINKKIVACVGKNGSGKSSVFDAFHFRTFKVKKADHVHGHYYLLVNSPEKKQYYIYDYEKNKEKYDGKRYTELEKIIKTDISFIGDHNIYAETFYLRSPYRISVNPIVNKQLDEQEKQQKNTTEIDGTIKTTYSKLFSLVYAEANKTEINALPIVRKNLLKKFNKIILSLLNIEIQEIGDHNQLGKGQIFFRRISDGKKIPYTNLSAGEKEIIEIFLDFWMQAKEDVPTIFCIDEPELHINTAMHKNFLIELDKLIPNHSQIWITTHSLGMIRTLQGDELKDKTAILNFSDIDESASRQILFPMENSYEKSSELLEIALDKVVGLISPENIFLCEGKAEPGENGEEEGFDSLIYQTIFDKRYPKFKFISAGGMTETKNYEEVIKNFFPKIFTNVRIGRIIDRDKNNDEKKENNCKILKRYSIESYLFDWEVIKPLIKNSLRDIAKKEHENLIENLIDENQKRHKQKIRQIINKYRLDGVDEIIDYKEMYDNIAKNITEDTDVYKELEEIIFSQKN